jgi:hypothetical protein
MTEIHPPVSTPRTAYAEWLATTVLAALSTYVVVLFLGTRVAGVVLSPKLGLPLLAALWVIARKGVRRAIERRHMSLDMLSNLSLLAGVLLVSFIGLDLAVSAYLNLRSPETDENVLSTTDRTAAIGEWYPGLYFPTAQNFRLLKPNFDVAGDHYGAYYLPSMLHSPTLVDSVLDRHRVSIHVNELGLREMSAIDSCQIFTLGDSFTFGWGVTDGATWPDLLERNLDTCVYNLGMADASPKQELLQLEYLLSHVDRRLRVRRLVWMIYEGNDLEDSYAEWSEAQPPSTLARATKGTILARLRDLVRALREESLTYRLRTGQVRLTSPARSRQYSSAYTIDGVRLLTPLFRSPTHGYLLLSPGDLQTASQPDTYVLQHPNRAELDKVFDRMAHLSDSLHFRVTVAIMPTSVRVYAPYFSFLPAPSAEPHFVNYVQKLARAEGFDTINLLQSFDPYARMEMLYFRDDDHLNPRGSEITARIISEHFGQLGHW